MLSEWLIHECPPLGMLETLKQPAGALKLARGGFVPDIFNG